jgi:short-subunit dehydrogenase
LHIGDLGKFAGRCARAALTELTRLVLPQMGARKRGKVMLLATLAAFQPGPGMAVYYATKSYVLSFGRAIGHELRCTGVTITTLCRRKSC